MESPCTQRETGCPIINMIRVPMQFHLTTSVNTMNLEVMKRPWNL